MVVDTLGLLVMVLVTAASLQDRDGGRLVLARARIAMPSILIKELKTPYTIVIVTHNMQQAARVSVYRVFHPLRGRATRPAGGIRRHRKDLLHPGEEVTEHYISGRFG